MIKRLMVISLMLSGAIVLPPDLTKIPGFTVVISSDAPVTEEVVDQLTDMGVDEDNIVLNDTSGD